MKKNGGSEREGERKEEREKERRRERVREKKNMLHTDNTGLEKHRNRVIEGEINGRLKDREIFHMFAFVATLICLR
jgi:hypothetical protein